MWRMRMYANVLRTAYALMESQGHGPSQYHVALWIMYHMPFALRSLRLTLNLIHGAPVLKHILRRDLATKVWAWASKV